MLRAVPPSPKSVLVYTVCDHCGEREGVTALDEKPAAWFRRRLRYFNMDLCPTCAVSLKDELDAWSVSALRRDGDPDGQ